MSKTITDLLPDKKIPCFYCNGSMSSQAVESSWAKGIRKVLITWGCHECKECFTFSGIEDETPDSLQFQCKEIRVFIYYKADSIALQVDFKQPIYLPYFEIDFSDKEKLYNKLRTYLLFS